MTWHGCTANAPWPGRRLHRVDQTRIPAMLADDLIAAIDQAHDHRG